MTEQTGLDKLKQLLKSRKLWAALVGVGLVVLRAYDPNFPLEDEDLTEFNSRAGCLYRRDGAGGWIEREE